MSDIQDVRLVTQANGCARITALGENLATGITKLYSAKLSIPDEGISYNLDTLKSKKRDTQANYDCGGTFVGLSKGNQQYEEKSMDITFGDDYNFVKEGIDATISRSTIKAMFDGTSILEGSDVIGILGTHGTRNIVASTNTLDTRFLLNEDGKLVNPNLKVISGAMETSANNAVTAYNDTTCVMMEFKYQFGTQPKGDRFAYFLSETCDFNEGSGADINKYAISGSRYCDPRDINKYLIEGVTYPETMATVGTDALYELAVDLIITVSGGGTPTVTGTAGQQIVVIDTADGTIELYKYGTTWIDVPVTSTLAAGAKIFSQSVDDALNGATATAKNAYVVCKTAGATTAAVAVDWKTGTAGSGSTTYLLDIVDWSYASRDFVTYTGE